MNPELVQQIPPEAAFGSCYQCRTNPNTAYIATYRETWEGDIVYCASCVTELTRVIGAIPKETHEAVVTEKDREIRRLKAKLNKARGKVKAIEAVPV